MTFDLISDPSQITTDWMTAVLRSSSTIDESTSVASVDVTDIGEDGGLLSLIYRASMTFDGGSGPASAMVKIPVPDANMRGTADVLGFYPRELAFYSEIAPGAPFGAAAIYGAAIASDSTDFVLVLEDLGQLRSVDQVAGASLDDTRAVLTAMGRFHAMWWGHEDIPAMSDRFLPINNPVYIAALPDVFAGGWPGCLEHDAATLPPALVEHGNRFGELVPWLLEEMMEPATFVHGDWRADNVFFDGTGPDSPVTMIDFQISGFAVGLYDVAYFVSQSIDADVRSGHDEDLVRHYLSVLADNGVELDFDTAWRKYQVCLAHCFIYAVTGYQSWDAWNDRQKELVSTMLDRSVRAIVDNDALSVLP